MGLLHESVREVNALKFYFSSMALIISKYLFFSHFLFLSLY